MKYSVYTFLYFHNLKNSLTNNLITNFDMRKLSIIFTLLFTAALLGYSQKYDVNKSDEAIKAFKEKDTGINKHFNTAYGYAVLPSVGKGAIGIGGANGKGSVYKKGNPVADVNMTQITIGFQFGGQSYAEIIFFKDKNAYTRFIEHKFVFSAQASAVALSAGVSVDAPYKDGVLIFTMAKGGLMYEASVGGQKFKVTLYE